MTKISTTELQQTGVDLDKGVYKLIRLLTIVSIIITLMAACGGGGNNPEETANLTLQLNNDPDTLVVEDVGGPYCFSNELLDGNDYCVTIHDDTGMDCTVTGGDDGSGCGIINGAPVTSITVDCDPV